MLEVLDMLEVVDVGVLDVLLVEVLDGLEEVDVVLEVG